MSKHFSRISPAFPIFPLSRMGLILGASLAFSGCAVGPDFQRPESALPDQYDEAIETTAAASPVNPEWWTLFEDEELNQLITLALANNQDLQAAVARMEAAEAAAREAGADYFPNVDLSGNSTRSRSNAQNATGQQITSTSRRLALNVGYELDLWGRIRRSNEAARAEALAGQFAHDAVRLSLTSQLAAEYLTLRVLDAELATTAETLKNREQTLKIVQGRQNAGIASALDLAQARAALAAAQAQWSQLRRQRALSENMLGLITGQPDLKTPPGDFETIPLPPLPPAGLPSSLLEARPDVREAEERLVAANARIGVAKAAYFPSISLTGLLGNESTDISNLFGNGTSLWSYGAALAMPIFNAGRTGARVDQATAAQKEALANYLKTVQNAFRETRDALATLREIKEEEAALSVQVEAAQKAQTLSEARYKAGYAGFLEVLDSQRTVNSAQLQQQTTRRNHLAAAVDLFRALGGGWRQETADIPAEPEASGGQ